MKESQIVTACLEYLYYTKDVKAWRNNSGAFKTQKGCFVRFGQKGSPDILMVHKGTFYGIEVKTPKGRQTDSQKEWQGDIESVGGIYWLIRSVDDLEELLHKHDII